MNPIDRDIADAFAALDRTAPESSPEEFSARVIARLGNDEKSATSRDGQASAALASPASADDSGLHDIKALASTARRRMSERESSEADGDESAVLLAAAHGGLRAVALPDPVIGRAARGKRAATAGPAGDRLRAETRSSAPFWILGSVATLAAAAAVAVFVFGIGRHKGKLGQAESAGEPALARTETPPVSAPAAPAVPPPGPRPSTVLVAPEEPALRTDDAKRKTEPSPARSSAEKRRGRAADAQASAPAAGSDREETAEQAAAPAGGAEAAPRPEAESGASLEDMLDSVTGEGAKPAPDPEERKRREAAKQEKKELDRRDVAKAMGEIRATVQGCRDLEQVSGTVTVKFAVAPTGQVSSAEATGAHARSRTGECVAGAVKQARFPAFDGPPMSFTYPFLLTE